MLKQLSKKNLVHLLCFSFEDSDRKDILEFEKLGVKVTLVPIDEPNAFKKALGVVLGSRPFSIAKYDTVPMRQAIEKILKEQSFDAIHVDHLHMANYMDLFKGIPCFLDEHNVEFKILERCFKVEPSPLKRMLYQQQSLKMKSFESQHLKKFKRVFACSEDDQRILIDISLSSVPVDVIPNGVDTGFFKAEQFLNPEEDAIVFTGSMDWLPNDDAITYFCGHILPLIWQKKQSVKFYVVGKNPSVLVKDLASRDPRVIVTGRVDDVRPYMQRSKVFIVPLRIGGGTRLKILEAMAMGKAVVSTSIGAEGIECVDGKNILLGDDPQDFAHHVLCLLDNPHRSSEIGIEARALVSHQYDWNSIGQTLNSIYAKTI